MELLQVSAADLSAGHSREKRDFSVSSIMGLREQADSNTKRKSSDDIDSIGSSVGSEISESSAGHGVPNHIRLNPTNNSSTRDSDGNGHFSAGEMNDEDTDDDASSGDSGLLKDINENLNDNRKDDSFDTRREMHHGKNIPSGTLHNNNNIERDKYKFETMMKVNSTPEQQSDLSALQKLYSLESMQRLRESSAVFPSRDYAALPNYNKPLMIDVGPGRSFSNANRMPSIMDTNREGEKRKKKKVPTATLR